MLLAGKDGGPPALREVRAPEPLRVLMTSPIGKLWIGFRDQVVTRIVGTQAADARPREGFEIDHGDHRIATGYEPSTRTSSPLSAISSSASFSGDSSQ